MASERTSTEAPYRRIVGEIRRRIESGLLQPGDRVPSARAITREWGVAIATATKVHATLREQGLTISRPGVGTVVAGPVPRREHELNRDRIVRVATAIADEHGMAELTMRRLAAELGVATMSLYRHVPGREELVLAMMDVALGTVRLPPRPPADWRVALEVCAREEWAVFQRHPWLGPSMSLTRPQLAPNGVLLTEWVLTAFDGTTLTGSERMYVQILLFTFVRGLSTALEIENEAVRETGMTGEQWLQTQSGLLTGMIDSGAIDHFRELTEHGFDFGLDQLFEFGLARLLDGIDLFVQARS
ncbi:GntR family transcriptional regulator [Paractinoplanes abujensis]|uniref:AcrR family transcriptional regulator n=1 Tax=Paractinoplanes abujensis TaxID=882441 RepID=A0A7W7D2M5_9ACTN|nr:TetR/AcrR family transcriptional regulator C-terminal domain-containing protein [Actinoplanes abujensis]MBB4697863.1 AcrR family transcriptional regulator [Actinoplanes abujensis]GID19653.1 GntR family transcriptional regulator [Actinoplanes abujensis]